jgi:hypothetical protein
MRFGTVEDDEDEDYVYRHKIATILSGSTQDAIDQCSILLGKILAVPSSSSFLDSLMRNGSDSLATPEELTLKMEDRGFYKLGKYLIRLSSSVDLSVGIKNDFDESNETTDRSLGRVPDVNEDDDTIDVVTRGKFEQLRINSSSLPSSSSFSSSYSSSSFFSNDRSKKFKSKENADRGSPRQFETIQVPVRKSFESQTIYEESRRAFDELFDRMRSIDYYLLSLKCEKITSLSNNRTSGSVGNYNFDKEFVCDDEIAHANNPLMLTNTLEHRCGQVCASIYVFDLELLVGIRHEIWRTEIEIHNLISKNGGSSVNIDITDEEEENTADAENEENDEKFHIISDALEESEKSKATEELFSKLKKLKTTYVVEMQKEKNKLYNLISLECFVKRPWIFVFYLPYRCYRLVRGKKDNNGFDFHAMVCEIVLQLFKIVDLYHFFLLATHGERVHVTFLNCGFDILDTYRDHRDFANDEETTKRLSYADIDLKRMSFEIYKRKSVLFYSKAKKFLELTDVDAKDLESKIILLNNDELSSESKKIAYLFYSKDRTRKYPVLTKINVKKIEAE